MKNDELEEFILDLMEKLDENVKEFILNNKTKELLQEFNLFKEIIENFPDKCDSILTEIISNLIIKQNSKNDVIFDNNTKNINDIFIIFIGEISITYYYSKNKKENKEFNNKKNDSTELLMGRGETFGKKFLMKKYKIEKIFNEDGDLIEDENNCFRIVSNSRSIVGTLNSNIYLNILEKYNTKERLEKISFIQKIEYFPLEEHFIEKFQRILIKRCFPKNSIISKQRESFRSIYLIISGLVRLSLVFNKTIHCNLDYDVLIGNLINERFSSSRLFEITGNYKEKENLTIIDMTEGEILGGIEFCKKLNTYLFKMECITDVKLYEINIDDFKINIKNWNLEKFFDKINSQLNFLKNRISNLKIINKEKSKKDDYSFSQNKFIATYRKGHPLNKKAKENIKKYTQPFNLEKIIQSKEFKLNTKYSKKIDYKMFKNNTKNIKKNLKNRRHIPFITNIMNDNLSQDINSQRDKQNSTVYNLKYQNGKLKTYFNDIINKKNENMKKNEGENNKKIIKINTNLKSNSINNKILNKKNIFSFRRLNSCCKIENNMKLKINQNILGSVPNIKNNNNSLHKTLSGRNDTNRLQVSSESINFMKNDLSDIKLYNSYPYMNALSIPNKNFNSILRKINKYSQRSINKKRLIFPYGIQEMYYSKNNNMDEIINKIISNRFIKGEFLSNNEESKHKLFISRKNKKK